MTAPTTFHLRNGGVSVVIDANAFGLPSIVYWGSDLGKNVKNEVIENIARAAKPEGVSGGLSISPRLTILPQPAHGWQGTPGVSLYRPQSGEFSFKLDLRSIEKKSGESGLVIKGADKEGGVSFTLALQVTKSGLLSQKINITNAGKSELQVNSVYLSFPIPNKQTELLDTTGRHLRERHPQRHKFTVGRHVRESRRGRPGADATLLLTAGTPNFGFESGAAHAVHLAWSGNHTLAAERGPNYAPFIQAGELLEPGEIVLKAGSTYQSPEALGSCGEGLNQVSHRFHDHLRQRSVHPTLPRPVTINTWEAVYFDMRLDRLKAIADAAAEVGAERFVLDDGWFKGRRDDTAGLGDWFVDKDVWPQGLQPLWDHVDKLGLQCGIWVEPEMINLNSDLGRKHPEWILRPNKARLPVEGRQQQVLDISNPDAFKYIFTCLDKILTDYPLIKYFKWDHNRDLLESGNIHGRAAIHDNVDALYDLMAKLKEKHPGLEIESCASGGARVDFGILQHTDRIWTSDCTDPLERLTIQKYTNLLVPNELIGVHVGAARSHTTGRTHGLHLRAGHTLFGHMGIEWDISKIQKEELQDLAKWIKLHKKWRDVIHTGKSVYADLEEESGGDLRGVVSTDQSRAIFTYTQTKTSQYYPAAPVTFPGLEDETLYKLKFVQDPATDKEQFVGQSPLLWTEAGKDCILSGKALRTAGVQIPTLLPETLIVFEVGKV
ncbi:alpha-galactosidase [Meira miltonrushii]|uniref:Alpha-galactosidase n=1 Tax=Meira miltonrushii TaxID=1280837 RepID=A0A316V953_9BASI|nr:alpha-galactosidase [Meira miltonrushii]PWN34020.1 alpha-galactosidase [Meira miltonrushii]